MSEIDWSKAPKQATHFDPSSECPWRIIHEDGEIYLWSEREGRWLEILVGDTLRWIARPSPWSGEGLPPVGTVCEAFVVDIATEDLKEIRPITERWEVGTVVAHVVANGKCLAVSQGDDHVMIGERFRPLRTSEQIAAEERDACIKQMLHDVRNSCDIFGDLYDLGYRKVEGGAE